MSQLTQMIRDNHLIIVRKDLFTLTDSPCSSGFYNEKQRNFCHESKTVCHIAKMSPYRRESSTFIMHLGKISETAPGEEFFAHPQHPYTQMLLLAIPVVSEEEEALKPEKVICSNKESRNDMVRLTVLYNLQPYVDENEFLQWRLNDHQDENMGTPGILRSDFMRIEGCFPRDADRPYRFMTTADWPDMESFESAFYDPAYQEGLKENLKLLKDPVFLIGEILAQENNTQEESE